MNSYNKDLEFSNDIKIKKQNIYNKEEFSGIDSKIPINNENHSISYGGFEDAEYKINRPQRIRRRIRIND